MDTKTRLKIVSTVQCGLKVFKKILSHAYVFLDLLSKTWKQTDPGVGRGNPSMTELGASISFLVFPINRIFNNVHALHLERGVNEKSLRMASPLASLGLGHTLEGRDEGRRRHGAPQTRLSSCLLVCGRACVCACGCACVQMHVRACVRACVHAGH